MMGRRRDPHAGGAVSIEVSSAIWTPMLRAIHHCRRNRSSHRMPLLSWRKVVGDRGGVRVGGSWCFTSGDGNLHPKDDPIHSGLLGGGGPDPPIFVEQYAATDQKGDEAEQ